MKIYYKIDDNSIKKYNVNSIILYKDESFGPSYNTYYEFQISLTKHFGFFLNFDTFSKQCLSVEGYYRFKNIKSEDIYIEKYKKGILLVEFNDEENELFSELNYEEKNMYSYEYLLDYKIKYDNRRSRICLGNINDDEIIMFGDGQFASFKNGDLIGIILDFKNGE